jgi:hypothetical protein
MSVEEHLQMESELCDIVEKASRFSGVCSLQNPDVEFLFLNDVPGLKFKLKDEYFKSHPLLKLDNDTEEAGEDTAVEAAKYVGQPLDLIITPAIIRSGNAAGERYDIKKVVFQGTSWIVKSKILRATKLAAPEGVPCSDRSAAKVPKARELGVQSAPATTNTREKGIKETGRKTQPLSYALSPALAEVSMQVASEQGATWAVNQVSGHDFKIYCDNAGNPLKSGEQHLSKTSEVPVQTGFEAQQPQEPRKNPAESLPKDKRKISKKRPESKPGQSCTPAPEQNPSASITDTKTTVTKRKSPGSARPELPSTSVIVDLTKVPDEVASPQEACVSKRQVSHLIFTSFQDF